ncbi:MAG: bifunctional folylpolyglutamate synthase/dihydrofolate synthase [Hyphomicrobiaceae bacterium]|nr:bifunctional folylpolyglutamate synthase/dihydrofolate synthase [Hyphomicrobiaceae bacterium]
MTSSKQVLARLRELHPSLIDLSLGRTKRALEKLGRPQDRLPPVIHIAGTNGKGSTLAYLNALIESSGKSCHSFISPHLVRFHERIRLAGKKGSADISEDVLVHVLERAEAANDGEPITFFEITMVAAFLAYSEHQADYLVLETGLGGRFDSTNVIDQPALTIITPISMDHMDFLGSTLEKIAFEKAGIMKKGVPCISGRQPRVVLDVLRQCARDLDAPFIAQDDDFKAYEQLGRIIYEDDTRLLALPLPRLIGSHQIDNAGLSIAAALRLPGLESAQQNMEQAMRQVRWPARLQLLETDRLAQKAGLNSESEIWLDGGHNRAAAEALAASMADLEEQVSRPLHLVIAMMKRKNAEEFLQVFEDLCEMVFTVPVPGSPNGWPPEELSKLAKQAGLRAMACEDVTQALEASGERARNLGNEPVRILICGSLYLAGSVLEGLE